jgi:hypothetical protein
MYEFGDDELDLERSFEDQGRFNLARDLIINSILKDELSFMNIEEPKEGANWKSAGSLEDNTDEAKRAELSGRRYVWIAKKPYKEFVVNFITIASIFDHQVSFQTPLPLFSLNARFITPASRRVADGQYGIGCDLSRDRAPCQYPDGLPESQGELEEFVARRAQELFGDEPARSTIVRSRTDLPGTSDKPQS